jgi:hypothetical protein
MRQNAWVSILVFLFGVIWFVWLGRHEPVQRRPGEAPPPDTNAEVAPDSVS